MANQWVDEWMYANQDRKSSEFSVKAAEKIVYKALCPIDPDSPAANSGKQAKRYKRNLRSAPTKVLPTWRARDWVHWKGRAGVFRGDVGDGEHSEVLIDGRVYRVRTGELS